MEKDSNKKIDVLLVGGYPPPYGGIAVHIMRLQNYLVQQKLNCKVLDIRFRKQNSYNIISIINFVKIHKVISDKPLIHLHVSSFGKLFKLYLLFQIFRNQKMILTIHSGNFINAISNRSKVTQRIFRNILSKVDIIIVVNNDQRNYLITNYKDTVLKTIVIPAFIFPEIKNSIINDCKSEKISIVASGAFFEYYGFEMILSFFKENQDIQGIIVFNGPYDKDYRKKIIHKIKDMNNVRYYENLLPGEFNSILKNSDIYIRNTDRDGDCVTIREAGFWDLQIVSSDLPSRPNGIEVFPYNNLEKFTKVIGKVLVDPKLGKMKKPINNASKILELYKENMN